jgi:hypothetical protein
MPVRGWLLLLCLLLTLWNPLTLAVVAASRVGSGTPASGLALALLAGRIIVTGVGMAAGMALWQKRPAAVQLAKSSLVLSALDVVARLSTRTGLSEAAPGTRLPLAVALILFNAAWYLYLEKSRRVRATYGLESRPKPNG